MNFFFFFTFFSTFFSTMSETQKKGFKNTLINNFKKAKKLKEVINMVKKRKNKQNEDSQQHVNDEITEDAPQIQVETDTNSKSKPNQFTETKHENESIEQPERKKLKTTEEVEEVDDARYNKQHKDSGFGEIENKMDISKLQTIEENKEITQKDDSIKEIEQQKSSEDQERYKLEEEINSLHNKLSEEQERYNSLHNKLSEEQERYNSLHNKLSEEQKRYDELEKKLKEEEDKLKKKEDEFSELEEKNVELRKEASKYQSALGNATNIRLGDEDSVKFRQDILDLHKLLETYVTNLKPNMDIDYEKVQAIAQKYGCSTPIDIKHKPFIKALLQRKVLDDILELSKEPVNKGEDVKLEMGIETKTRELLDLIENFSANRSGTDEIAKVASIKVRQQVYGILGNRGFADVPDPNDPNGSRMHDFITYVSDYLNNTMNQCRIIKDSNKKREAESVAPKLIQDIYKLFFYLLNVQEPRIEYKFCDTGSKIDPNVMKGNWDDDDVPQLCVDICSFPMIGRNLDSSNWKIYTHAKVFPYNPSNPS
jgi:myosin heavy subunit